MPMPTLGELFGVEFKNSASKKFAANEKEIIDKFFELLKNKFKGAKLKNSYYYNKYSDWYPYLYTDFIDKTYKIGRAEYTFCFQKLYIEGKKRISHVAVSGDQANSLVEEYGRTLSQAEVKRLKSKNFARKSKVLKRRGWFKGIDQDDLELITAISFDIRSDAGKRSLSDIFYIPTRYMNDDTSSWLTEACVKNVKKIYFPKMIRLFKKNK